MRLGSNYLVLSTPPPFKHPEVEVTVLQEGGPLPGPDSGLLSNTQK